MKLRKIAFATLLLCFSSCTFINSLIQPGSKKEQVKSSVSQQRAEISAKDGIELVWGVPSEPVDGFIVKYGYSKDQLDRSARVPLSTLTSSQDIEFGSVFRYSIKPIEAGKIVYISLASYKGDEISEFGEIFEEGPLKK